MEFIFQDTFFNSRDTCLEDLDKQYEVQEREVLKNIQRKYQELNLEHFSEVKQRGVSAAIQGISDTGLNAACIKIFFMDKFYKDRAVDFLPFVFNQVQERDFLILTQPQVANEIPLLKHFGEFWTILEYFEIF